VVVPCNSHHDINHLNTLVPVQVDKFPQRILEFQGELELHVGKFRLGIMTNWNNLHVWISFGCIKMLNMILWPKLVIDLFMNCIHNSIIFIVICGYFDADIEVFTPVPVIH